MTAHCIGACADGQEQSYPDKARLLLASALVTAAKVYRYSRTPGQLYVHSP